jgi:hypothetical protein
MERSCDISGRVAARLRAASSGLAVLLLAACATPSNPPHAPSEPLRPLHRENVLWLERISFGLNTRNVADYRRLGRERFLDQQLHPVDETLPAPIAAQIASLEITGANPVQLLAGVNAQYKVINAMPDGPDKEQARKALNDHGNQLA